MSRFPETADELRRDGYQFQKDAVCNRCGGESEWYVSDKGSWIPFDPMPRGSSPAFPHWKTCTG